MSKRGEEKGMFLAKYKRNILTLFGKVINKIRR